MKKVLVLLTFFASAAMPGASALADVPQVVIRPAGPEVPTQSFKLGVTEKRIKDIPQLCTGMLSQATFQPYPAPGSIFRWTNTSSTPLFLAFFTSVSKFKLPGMNMVWGTPLFESGLSVVPDSVAKTAKNLVIELQPGEAVDEIIPVPVADSDIETVVSQQCQLKSEFLKRPKFSYGAGYRYSNRLN
jgi:hypothetical protein